MAAKAETAREPVGVVMAVVELAVVASVVLVVAVPVAGMAILIVKWAIGEEWVV